MIEEDLVAFLSGDSEIAQRVSDRLYPALLPQGASGQSIVYTLISGRRDRTIEGANGIARLRLQLDCRAAKYGDVKRLALAVRRRLNDYRGRMGNSTVLNTVVDGENDFYDPEAELHRVSQDVIITYRED